MCIIYAGASYDGKDWLVQLVNPDRETVTVPCKPMSAFGSGLLAVAHAVWISVEVGGDIIIDDSCLPASGQ